MTRVRRSPRLAWKAPTDSNCVDVVLHVHAVREGICAISITDQEYPGRVARALCRKIANEFTSTYPRAAYADAQVNGPQLSFPELKRYLDKYQNPEEADNIAKIQKELDETKAVMQQTIESVLERGEKIDNLVAKSDGLSAQSKMFYTQVCLVVVGTACVGILIPSCRPRSRILVASSCERVRLRVEIVCQANVVCTRLYWV